MPLSPPADHWPDIPAPVAPRVDHEIRQLGRVRNDPYAWMRFTPDSGTRTLEGLPEPLRRHLTAEMQYAEQMLAPLAADRGARRDTHTAYSRGGHRTAPRRRSLTRRTAPAATPTTEPPTIRPARTIATSHGPRISPAMIATASAYWTWPAASYASSFRRTPLAMAASPFRLHRNSCSGSGATRTVDPHACIEPLCKRSEERRVGKEGRTRVAA